MKESRRSFLKIAGVSALGLTAASNAHAIGEYFIPSGKAIKDQKVNEADRWGMVIDTRKLTHELNEKIGKACHINHNVPELDNKNHEIKWIWEEHYEHAFTQQPNEYQSEKAEHAPILVLCNHCENPPCVQACPTKATFQREDGIVLMDFHRCIGCRFCMAACPYGSRSFNFQDPRNGLEDGKPTNPEFPTRTKGVVEKCNFCAERLAVGKDPYCVEASEGALVFGDLSDEKSEIRKVLKENYTIRRKASLGTGPSVFYIV
ncbi:sulfate reduction electron transfer complex DsrMKJOP subunit DsrO [Desulfoluna spongiiphila]|uniref:Putative sulfite reductase-associated electron transfer protein DsrO n=1 Tax=Desulfoluna spongiiphila TaxID=419481 RepID=A0A1G5I9W2_9BACT|nr:4Fe-4S dicluster domain-containing protein [Desulfoluna spongiiphila]SCY72813.1 putative sulfite reductase-associated electron transfer protein DsrO [Desulfoluna spongiiphila]VVS93162.1 twin-arginine translocation pathway signal sequence [Desulfoluna spongiiphila]